MRGLGFEPKKALSHIGLNDAHLTALASPRGDAKLKHFKRLAKKVLETKTLILNTMQILQKNGSKN